MTYSVKECFYTLQGEGAQTGRAAVFLRFAGCNLWSGLARDRATAVCRFCDTDFVGTNGDGGGKFATADMVAAHVEARWGGADGKRYVVCTGGEPLLQLDKQLISALHAKGFEVAVETNGTVDAPSSLDWVCVSPKSTAELKQTSGDELKLVYPQPDALPDVLRKVQATWTGATAIELASEPSVDAALERDLLCLTSLNDVVPELVFNAVRHGGANHIEIRLSRRQPRLLELVVADNGIAGTVADSRGLGTRLLDDCSISWSRVVLDEGSVTCLLLPLLPASHP